MHDYIKLDNNYQVTFIGNIYYYKIYVKFFAIKLSDFSFRWESHDYGISIEQINIFYTFLR